MFATELKVKLRSGTDPHAASARKRVYLPFPPFPGLRICGSDLSCCVLITQVTWSLTQHCFECICEDVIVWKTAEQKEYETFRAEGFTL